MSASKNLAKFYAFLITLGLAVYILLFVIVRAAMAAYLPQALWAWDTLGLIYIIATAILLVKIYQGREYLGFAGLMIDLAWALFEIIFGRGTKNDSEH